MRGSRLKKKRQSSLSGEAGKRRLILAAQNVLFSAEPGSTRKSPAAGERLHEVFMRDSSCFRWSERISGLELPPPVQPIVQRLIREPPTSAANSCSNTADSWLEYPSFERSQRRKRVRPSIAPTSGRCLSSHSSWHCCRTRRRCRYLLTNCCTLLRL
jgi:hypothetical protein